MADWNPPIKMSRTYRYREINFSYYVQRRIPFTPFYRIVCEVLNFDEFEKESSRYFYDIVHSKYPELRRSCTTIERRGFEITYKLHDW